MANLPPSQQIPPASGWFKVTTNKDGSISVAPTEGLFRFLVGQQGGVRNVNSGAAQAIAQLQAQLAAEAASRVAGDAANQASGDGTGTSNSTVYSGGVSSGATWVAIATTSLTPTGAGFYTISVLPDLAIYGHLSNDNLGLPATFNGNYRLVEEETGGGTPVTLYTGTFTVSYTPASTVDFGEGGGGSIEVPESWGVTFNSLPASPIASNYTVQSDIRLEIQRSSGSNEITSPGLSGSMMVQWNP